MSAVFETRLARLPLLARGKVRDVYDLGQRLLIVATDRISAFDAVFPTPIPDKGRVLTQLSLFWFTELASQVPNHLIGEDLAGLDLDPAERTMLAGRAMVVKKAKVFPIECVARGYLAGSGWKEYRARGSVCGVALPQGLREADRLPEPIFTPATKAETGHDENIPFARMEQIVGAGPAAALRAQTLQIYARAAALALARGIVIADTKFEFGLVEGRITLVDEALTPDSSRFWPVDAYRPGGSPPSFDKQYLRDWVERSSGWNKEPPAPPLPAEVVQATRERYLEAFARLTGRPFAA